MRMRTLGHLWTVSALTLGNPPATEVPARLERSLDASLERMHLSFVELFVLHAYMVNTDDDAADDRFSTELDLQTRVMAAVCIASIVAMTLLATGYPAGGVLSAGLGISGIVGAVAMVGRGGDDVSRRFLPAVLAVFSLSLIALAIRWVAERPIHFGSIHFGGLSLAIVAIAIAVAMG